MSKVNIDSVLGQNWVEHHVNTKLGERVIHPNARKRRRIEAKLQRLEQRREKKCVK